MPRLIALFLLTPLAAFAHPHAWIDLQVQLEIDAGKTVTELTQTWVFDPVYTMILVEEFEQELADSDRQAQLKALGQRMLDNMAKHDHMTRIRHDGTSLATGPAEDMRIRLNDADQLEFTFTLPLRDPVSIGENDLEYEIFDPTYYIEMLHQSAADISLAGHDEACKVRVSQPSPTAAQIARAAAVDLGRATADGLGKHFAQLVTVSCKSTHEAD